MENLTVFGYSVVMTCSACPEQYEVFRDGNQVGYLRLRHGWFRADYPECGGETVYESEDVRGDGSFDDEIERLTRIGAAVSAIHNRIRQETP